MTKEQLHKSVKDLIKNNNTEQVFHLLDQHPLDPQTTKILTLTQAEFNNLKQAELKGVLNFQEIQIRKNQINDKLLAIAQGETLPSPKTNPVRNDLIKKLLPIVLILIGIVVWWLIQNPAFTCPDFPSDVRNKILIIPFENAGDKIAKPQILLRDRINQLVAENDLSANAKLGETVDNMAMDKALILAEKCQAGLLVWGTYSSRADSIRLVLQYYFPKAPEWSNSGELLTLKDVTGLQKGQMLKSFDDAVFSLCGVIAVRDGNNALAEKWMKKVREKDEVDIAVLDALK